MGDRSAPVAEEARWERDPAALELVQEARPKSRRAQSADDRAIRLDAVDLELEQLRQRDDLGLHPPHLGDRGDAARAVLHPLDVDDEIERRGDLLPDGLDRKVVP